MPYALRPRRNFSVSGELGSPVVLVDNLIQYQGAKFMNMDLVIE